jgi:hypothetical protein
MNNPIPVPSKDFLANFENSLGNISGVRKNNRIQSDYQICARIMQARIKLERNELFTKWLKSYKVVVF